MRTTTVVPEKVQSTTQPQPGHTTGFRVDVFFSSSCVVKVFCDPPYHGISATLVGLAGARRLCCMYGTSCSDTFVAGANDSSIARPEKDQSARKRSCLLPSYPLPSGTHSRKAWIERRHQTLYPAIFPRGGEHRRTRRRPTFARPKFLRARAAGSLSRVRLPLSAPNLRTQHSFVAPPLVVRYRQNEGFLLVLPYF